MRCCGGGGGGDVRVHTRTPFTAIELKWWWNYNKQTAATAATPPPTTTSYANESHQLTRYMRTIQHFLFMLCTVETNIIPVWKLQRNCYCYRLEWCVCARWRRFIWEAMWIWCVCVESSVNIVRENRWKKPQPQALLMHTVNICARDVESSNKSPRCIGECWALLSSNLNPFACVSPCVCSWFVLLLLLLLNVSHNNSVSIRI